MIIGSFAACGISTTISDLVCKYDFVKKIMANVDVDNEEDDYALGCLKKTLKTKKGTFYFIFTFHIY